MSRAFFTENAYSVLGLETSSSEKEIVKRSREIENLLKIDIVPDYDVDFQFSKDSRTESKVKKAVEKLTTPDKKIIETFFWLTIKDSNDEKAISLFRDGNIVEAIDLYERKINSSPNNYLAWRNKAVLESLAFSEKGQNKYLEASLKSWKTILSSDKQWVDFKKIYLLNNQNIGSIVFDDFKKNAEKILSGFYESMSNTEGKPEIYAAFGKRFSAHSDAFDKNTLDPLLVKLNDATNRLKKCTLNFTHNDFGDSKKLTQECRNTIKEAEEDLDHLTDKIQALGDTVWNSTKAKITRDDCALVLRNKAIDIVNNSSVESCPSDMTLAENLLHSAYNISSEDSAVEKKILQDKEDFKNLQKDIKYAKTINELKPKLDRIVYLVKNQRFNDAIPLIDACLEYDLNYEDERNLNNMREKCVEAANRKDAETAKNVIVTFIIIVIIILFIAASSSH